MSCNDVALTFYLNSPNVNADCTVIKFFVNVFNSDSYSYWLRERLKALLSSACTSTNKTCLAASSEVHCWRFSSALGGVVRMLGFGYREVNQDQSSDPPALFRTSKAYSSVFSQYTLAAISAVSPHKALCMCVWQHVCVSGKSYEFQESGTSTHTPTYLRIESHEFTHTHVWGQWVPSVTSDSECILRKQGPVDPCLLMPGSDKT